MASVDLGEMAASHWGFGVGTGPCLRGCGCDVPAGGAGEQKASCQGSSNSLGHQETHSLGAERGTGARARMPPAGVPQSTPCCWPAYHSPRRKDPGPWSSSPVLLQCPPSPAQCPPLTMPATVPTRKGKGRGSSCRAQSWARTLCIDTEATSTEENRHWGD